MGCLVYPIQIPVSPGELLDKITILEIKSRRMTEPTQLAHVRQELALLHATWTESVVADDTVRRIRHELERVNGQLWDLEEDIRAKESAREFDARFIDLARSIYATNDLRCAAKRELNAYLGSDIVEEKSYGLTSEAGTAPAFRSHRRPSPDPSPGVS